MELFACFQQMFEKIYAKIGEILHDPSKVGQNCPGFISFNPSVAILDS
jgi:hypothetical protein